MADVKGDVLEFHFDSSTNPQVITGDLGGDVPLFAWAIATDAYADDTWEYDCVSMQGFHAQTASTSTGSVSNQFTMTTKMVGNVSPSAIYTGMLLNAFFMVPDPNVNGATVLATCVMTPIANGISLQWTGTPLANRCRVLILSGADLNSHAHYQHNNAGSATITTGFPISASTFLLGTNITDGASLTPGALGNRNGNINCGFYNDGAYASVGFTSRYNRGSPEIWNSTWNNRLVASNSANGSAMASMVVTSSTATTISVAPLGGDNIPRAWCICSVDLGGNGVDLALQQAAAQPSTMSKTGLGFAPKLAFMIGGNNTGFSSERNANNGMVGHVFKKKGVTSSMGMTYYARNLTSPSEDSSLVVTTPEYQGSSASRAVRWQADGITLDSDGWSIPFSQVETNTYHIVLALDVDIGGASVTPIISAFAPSRDYVADGQPNNVITGTDFEAQGAGSKVEINDGGTPVECTIDNWTDTEITFTAVTTGVAVGPVDLIVTNDGGGESAAYALAHVDILPVGSFTGAQVNARVNQAVGTPINWSQDVDIMTYVADKAVGSTLSIHADLAGK